MSEITIPGLFQKFKQKLEYIFGNNISWQCEKYLEFLNIFINLFRITGENKVKNCFFCKLKLIKRVRMNIVFLSGILLLI